MTVRVDSGSLICGEHDTLISLSILGYLTRRIPLYTLQDTLTETLLRHPFSLPGHVDFSCLDISCQFDVGRADITATATLDTRTHIISLGNIQQIVFDGMSDFSRIEILRTYLQASAAMNARCLAPGKFCPANLFFRQKADGIRRFRDRRLQI